MSAEGNPVKAVHESPALAYRHNRVTRITHWTNAVALMILFMSGLMIFNAHPHLYWGHTSEPGTAFLSIGATNDDGDLGGYLSLYGQQIDTTGILGVQQTGLAPSARAFPSWLTIPGYYSLAGARRWHFFFGWWFAINGLLYVVYNIAVGHMRKFFFTPGDAAQVPAMMAHYLHLRKDSPQQGEYNPLQKMAYTGVFVFLTPLILLSGMAMSPQLNVAFHWLPTIFGGRQSARSIHFLLAFGFLSFAFGHVFMVLTQGFFNNMRSMITGWYMEKAPRVIEPTRAPPPGPDIAAALKSADEPPAPVEDQATGDAQAAVDPEEKPAPMPELEPTAPLPVAVGKEVVKDDEVKS
jgi:Ni/Fe-hydrogenase b-type cytochrome subunit